jgi:arylsulfatase A-like enzyme
MRATAKLPSFVRGWPEMLREAGYYTFNNFRTDYNANIEFPPTVLSLARVAVPRYMQGTPFLGRSRRTHAYAYGQRSRMDERYDLQRTVRDERYLYIRNYMPHRARAIGRFADHYNHRRLHESGPPLFAPLLSI